MLKLAGEVEIHACPTCGGKGRVPCPKRQAVRTGVGGVNAQGAVMTPGDGFPIPCPACKGRKTVAFGGVGSELEAKL